LDLENEEKDMKQSLRLTLLVALTMVAISGLAAAQEPVDPPGRIARLQYIEGQVSMQPGGVDDWIDVSLNRPLTTADRLWTDRDSRAELAMGTAAVRLGSETSLGITNLNDNTMQIELDQGTMNLAVRYMAPDEIIEVDTPNFAYTIDRPGEFRIDVYPDSDRSRITVIHGEGEATGQGDPVFVRAGQSFLFSSGQSLYYTTPGWPMRDDFDGWCREREQRVEMSMSARYVAPGTIGYEDLDDNGYWEQSPVYGSVWYPRVHPGWAPYHEGHWAWVEPWGWTWVDDAPWGFAPFHYGRWVNAGGRWGWVPGPREVRPVYAPALVAWVGGVSIGIGGGGGVAWVPLGWHDPFIPSYHVSQVYARNVNVSNSRVVNVTVINNYYTTTNVTVRNTTINNIKYENTTVNGAVTGVSSNAFASGRPVAKEGVTVSSNQMSRGNMMATASVAPTKAAVLGGHAPAMAPARLVAPKAVVANTPPPARPVSFEQQRSLLEKSGGMPLNAAAQANIRATSPAPAPRYVQPTVVRPTPTNQPAGVKPAQTRQPQTTQPAQTNQPAWGKPAQTNQPPAQTHQPEAVKPAQTYQPPAQTHQPEAVKPAQTYQPPAQTHQPEAVRPPQTYQPPVVHPATPPAPAPAATHPVQPPQNAQQTAQPAGQKKTPPPGKENKEKEKEKEKEAK
jgi:hypothetical protein